MLTFIILGLAIALVHVNSNSHSGGCTATYTTTCPITLPTCGSYSNDSIAIGKKLEQVDMNINQIKANLDR